MPLILVFNPFPPFVCIRAHVLSSVIYSSVVIMHSIQCPKTLGTALIGPVAASSNVPTLLSNIPTYRTSTGWRSRCCRAGSACSTPSSCPPRSGRSAWLASMCFSPLGRCTFPTFKRNRNASPLSCLRWLFSWGSPSGSARPFLFLHNEPSRSCFSRLHPASATSSFPDLPRFTFALCAAARHIIWLSLSPGLDAHTLAESVRVIYSE